MSVFDLLSDLLDRHENLEPSDDLNDKSDTDTMQPSDDPYPGLEYYKDAEEQTHCVADLFLRQGWKEPTTHPDIGTRPPPPPSLLRIERMPPDERFPRVDYFIENMAVQPSNIHANTLYFLHRTCWARVQSHGFERSMRRASEFAEEQEKGLGTRLRFVEDLRKTGLSRGLVRVGRRVGYMYTENVLNGVARDVKAKHKIALYVDGRRPNDGENHIRFVKQVWKEEHTWEVRIMVGKKKKGRHDSLKVASEEQLRYVEDSAKRTTAMT